MVILSLGVNMHGKKKVAMMVVVQTLEQISYKLRQVVGRVNKHQKIDKEFESLSKEVEELKKKINSVFSIKK